MGADQGGGGDIVAGRFASAVAPDNVAAASFAGGLTLDAGIAGAALFGASYLLKPRLARRIVAFYDWYMAHTKCRWCVNAASIAIAALLLMA
jgi:hypothetical protein